MGEFLLNSRKGQDKKNQEQGQNEGKILRNLVDSPLCQCSYCWLILIPNSKRDTRGSQGSSVDGKSSQRVEEEQSASKAMRQRIDNHQSWGEAAAR